MLLSAHQVIGQTDYETACNHLSKGEVEQAIEYFIKASKQKETKEHALIALALIESQYQQDEEASTYFNQYFDAATDPYPVTYAAWNEGGIVGPSGSKSKEELVLVEKMNADPRSQGKLYGATLYQLIAHYAFSFQPEKSKKYVEEINSVTDWSLLGPFDNVMNSGFNKNFGALEHADAKHTFTSRYGAHINWFHPELKTEDGYVFKDAYFISENTINYAQTFFDLAASQTLLLKLGYSGSMKLWVNDSLVYSQAEKRVTEMDYFQFKLELPKGNNRILVQLGDYEESFPNFMIRLTDLQHQPLALTYTPLYEGSYNKQITSLEPIPYFAWEGLNNMNPLSKNDFLPELLKAMAHIRAFEINEAEEILLSLYEQQPSNLLVLRTLIVMYSKTDNNTSQNKFYEQFRKTFPYHIDILSNDIDEYEDKENKEKVVELIDIYLERYPDPLKELLFEVTLAKQKQQTNRVLALLNEAYDRFPNDYDIMNSQYALQSSYYKNPAKAEKVLQTYLKTNYNYNVIMELVRIYSDRGDLKKAQKLLEESLEVAPYDVDARRKIVNILNSKGEYEEAIAICNQILRNMPTNYLVYKDKAILFNILGKTDSSLANYQASIEHFPFSFENNERMRELSGLNAAMDFVETIEPEEIIADFNQNFKPTKKANYDVVYENHNVIIHPSLAIGEVYRYILRVNNEEGIEKWQNITLRPNSIQDMFLNDAKTIKANGQQLDAERDGGDIVFTNLEPGDFIYVSYVEKQVNGGKTSMFYSDDFLLNSYSPTYKLTFDLFIADELTLHDTLLNGELRNKVEQLEGFKQYSWSSVNPTPVKSENYVTAFGDIAQKVHVSLNYTWNDIVQWYSDLSAQQAEEDYTIRKIISELFPEGKDNYTQEEKARKIYNFIGENIVYSSVDFRQGSFIPQKASKVYHSRLGDCKDVSTLFVALARAVGLKANMVLINTTNNGFNDIVLPSLNFNHCIVKVYFDNDDIHFLELTDPNLPYGHLSYYHNQAAILEIPQVLTPDYHAQLERLPLNKGYESHIIREARVAVDEAGNLQIAKQAVKTGYRASRFVKSYFYADSIEQRTDLEEAIANDFESTVKLNSFDFVKLQPREDSAIYNYDYVVEKGVLELGSIRSLKIPFADELVTSVVLQEKDRQFPFDYMYYEQNELYREEMEIELTTNRFKETPENISLSYGGNRYELKFELLTNNKMKVVREFKPERKTIAPEEYEAFKAFLAKIKDAENTHLLFN